MIITSDRGVLTSIIVFSLDKRIRVIIVCTVHPNLLFLFVRKKHTHKRKREWNSNTKIHQKLYLKAIMIFRRG